jgi:hypothetical protein
MDKCRVVSIVSQVEQAPPVATTTKTPTYEYYGFVMYLVSFVVLGKDGISFCLADYKQKRCNYLILGHQC